jgi:hypothetical protein
MLRKGLLTGCIAAVALLAIPSVALAATQSASSGTVSASLSFQGSGITYTQLHLTITRGGQAVYNGAVRSRFCASPYCIPLATGPHESSVHVIALQPGDPSVVVDLLTGGAHCCEVEQVYAFDPGKNSFVKTERNFGNAGDVITDLGHNGRFEFVGADDAFFYAFTSYAASGAPIQIWSFGANRFVNVTRRYPSQIKHDAALWWKLFTKHYSDGEGLIAAWAADEDLLGQAALVKSRLATEARKNHLRSGLSGMPSGQKFVTALQKFLRRLGYTH